MFAGIVGTLTRRTYTFYGDAINTAARIMVRAADGQLLAREDVLERARTTYAATPIEPFAAKGKAELVRASDVGAAVGEREQEAIGPVRRARGRARRAARCADQARRGAGRPRDRHGRSRPRQDAAAGRAVRAGRGRPHAARALRAEGRQPPVLGRRRAHAARAAARRRTPRRATWSAGCAPPSPSGAPQLEPWLPLLGLVVGLSLPATPETAALEERFVSERIAAAVEALLERVVPDAALIVDRRRALHGRGLGGAARPHRRRHRARGAGCSSSPTARTTTASTRPRASSRCDLPLAPLDAAAALLLVVQLTEDAPLPAHVAAAVAQRSDGSPLFVTEMVAAMRAGADHDTLPESVEALMALQIDELASADRGVLRQASVMGVALHARRPRGCARARRGRVPRRSSSASTAS